MGSPLRFATMSAGLDAAASAELLITAANDQVRHTHCRLPEGAIVRYVVVVAKDRTLTNPQGSPSGIAQLF
ncbi:hypothetical protein OKW43_005299 [Paraburkholderia sp. WC7.3g]|uniref:hypothetical protein n=1 Tax=Paraburkholderia sp. WC7.3g TaxID=2991070 RepID=UPI003D1F7708